MNDSSIKVMGVLNVTPDSFFDGGQYTQISHAVDQALLMEKSGASIIDIGGESTRPGADLVGLDEELNRVIPVIESLRQQSDIQISIDTYKPQVMREAVNAGATMINDVYALQQDGALEAASRLDVPVCLMHMLGEPRSMQKEPQYDDVVAEVSVFLQERIDSCLKVGIKRENICLDPGFGFGKTLQHNLSLLKHLNAFVKLGFPILVGVSRKSMLAAILDVDVHDRLVGSLALATMAMMNGASILRVHDVKETKQVSQVCEALLSAE